MIRSLAELPFPRRDPLALLHLDDVERAGVDADYTGFGHGRVDALTLVAAGARPAVTVCDALVIALHCTDPCAPLDGDIELEFALDELAPGLAVSAPLSRFLAVWLPRVVRGDERAVVLALCNPHRARIPRPGALAAAAAPLYYAEGEVESWYDDGVRLVADAWRIAR